MRNKGRNIDTKIIKTAKFIGNFLMISTCLLLIFKLFDYGKQIKWSVIWDHKWIVFFEILSSMLIVLFSPLSYKILIRLTTGTKVSFGIIQSLCCKTNLYKYLPGNVFQYIGKNQLAVILNLKHTEVALATFLEILMTVVSSTLVAFLFSGNIVALWIKENKRAGIIPIAVGCIIMLAFFICRKKRRTVLYKFSFFRSIHNVIGLMEVIGWQVCMIVTNAILFVCTFIAMGFVLELKEIQNIIGLFALSFCVGFVTPGAPGGMGIREMMFVIFMGQAFSEVQIVAVAVLFRFISVLGDVLAYFVCICKEMILRRERTENEIITSIKK